jgi:hypothetical protein
MQEATGLRVTHRAMVPPMPEAFTGVAQPTDLIMAEGGYTGTPERPLITIRAMADFITITGFLWAE